MYLTINVNKGSPSGKGTEIRVNSPCMYKSTGENPGILYYTRLPSNMCEEEVIAKVVERDWDFVSITEYNFLIVFVPENQNRPSWTLVRDRYGSQRVLIRQAQDNLIVTSDPRAVRDGQTQWNPLALRYALVSRIITTVALEEGVSVLPLSNGLTYDREYGLDFIETGAKKLRIQESKNRFSDQELIERTKESIFESYRLLNRQEPVAVLLSGGVDSFILAATACQQFKNVKAYTPTWNEGENPELERAVVFAKKLNIEHHIVTISPEDFKLSFFETIEANGIPNRNYSSLVLHALIKNIPEENILYGEYADTLFGSFPIKTGIMDRKYAVLVGCIPSAIIPGRFKSLLSKVRNARLSQLIEIPFITEEFVEQCLCYVGVDFRCKNYGEQKNFSRVSGIEFNLKTDCSQHMVEIETSALLLGKKIIAPFYNQRMVTISNSLSSRQMFGVSGLGIRRNFRKDTSRQVKPLLKKLACQFIEPEIIYKNKLGFPIPFNKWIKIFEKSHEEPKFKRCFKRQGPEEIWSAINFMYLTDEKRFGGSSGSEGNRRKAP